PEHGLGRGRRPDSRRAPAAQKGTLADSRLHRIRIRRPRQFRRRGEALRRLRQAGAGVTRIGMGLVGPGFVGAHHIDAVRRLGFVDVVAVAASSDASARRKADALGVPKAYGSFEALVADPDIHVVHNTTPNYLHVPVILAALAHGKHVISDKPLVMTAADARLLLDAANKAGVVHAVTFNYRGNPLVQQARE